MRACVCSLVKGRGGKEGGRGGGERGRREKEGVEEGEGKGWKGKWHECIYTNAAIFERKCLLYCLGLSFFFTKLV